MLNHRNQCNGGNGEDSVQLELRYAQKLRHNVLIHKGKEVRLSHCGKIAEAKRQADKVACDNGKQNRHQVENPFCKMDTQMTTVRITTVTSTDFRLNSPL